MNQAKLTAAAICTLRPQRVMVRRATRCQLLDTRLGTVTLLPGDFLVRLPTGEELAIAARDAAEWLRGTDEAGSALLAARPGELVTDALPCGGR